MAVNALPFKYESITNLKLIEHLHLLVLVDPFTDPNDRFPYPFFILLLVKSLPFHTPEAWKRYLFSGRASLFKRIS